MQNLSQAPSTLPPIFSTCTGSSYHKSTVDGIDIVLFIHGLFGSSRTWEILARKLQSFFRAQESPHFIAIDLIGHGRSPFPSGAEHYSFESHLNSILRVIELHISAGHCCCSFVRRRSSKACALSSQYTCKHSAILTLTWL